MVELVERWDCLVDLPGAGYSGRLPLLLHSGRPVLIVEREWDTWYMHHRNSTEGGLAGVGLEPWRSYIPVQGGLEDLVEKARWVREHRERAKEIGLEGQRVARKGLSERAAMEFLASELRRIET